MAGLLRVETQLALPCRLRHHRLHHRQDDRRIHRGGPQELQVRPGAQVLIWRPRHSWRAPRVAQYWTKD
ncbi:hypothetical protein GUJ93_ZPchr0004g38113 [Zizania palustris]|uniref:Uncharacterized protein n=1 Tax=Zizania palustris TaxID=103762 RepID=A0A8J5SIF1_ZIZPA|nr:hypothetical protein GUJ93_ZPchr0004g38113 [Zizania palustris]